MNRTRITFDFEGAYQESYEKLVQIICSSHWGSSIDILGSWNQDHRLLFDFIRLGVIVIDECAYDIPEPEDCENARHIDSLLGKRSSHPVMNDMAVLFAGEPFEASKHYRNTIYYPNIKAVVRADGIKPEDIAEMLSRDDCDKIILFPYFPLDDKKEYYELTLDVEKERFVDYLNHVAEKRQDEMNESIRHADERSKAGYRSVLRLERKSDWKTVEQITYRAFCDGRSRSPSDSDDGMNA